MSDAISRASPEKTLLWIGPIDHPEVADHWHAMRLTKTVHHRKDLDELKAHPVTTATHVLMVRLDRTAVDPAAMQQIRMLTPHAQYATLEGALRGGAQRSEMILSGWERWFTSHTTVQLSRWIDAVPMAPLETCSLETCLPNSRMSHAPIALVGGLRSDVMYLADWFLEQQIACVALASSGYRGLLGYAIWIWDETAIHRLGQTEWHDAVRFVKNAAAPQGGSKPWQNVLATFPTWDQCQVWKDLGIDRVIAKPLIPLRLDAFLPSIL